MVKKKDSGDFGMKMKVKNRKDITVRVIGMVFGKCGINGKLEKINTCVVKATLKKEKG